MPIFAKGSMNVHSIAGSNYGFSAKRIEDLGATEYTLGLIVVDVSGSVGSFRDEIEAAIKEVVRSCRKHPRADNMMLRLVLFDDKVKEAHGFKPLTECHVDDYSGVVRIGGMTALYDAIYNGVSSAARYGRALMEQGFDCNAALFVITDGMDNRSKVGRGDLATAFKDAVEGESLESLQSILIGVNTEAGDLDDYLDELKSEAGFDQFISIGMATAAELSRLGGFVASSISTQSQALGSGSSALSLLF